MGAAESGPRIDDGSQVDHRSPTDEGSRGDQGLFGPGSVTWKIHSHPVLLVGGLRALIIQSLHPLALAGVTMYSDFRADPMRRLRGTAGYVHAVTFGDVREARDAAGRVKRLHERVQGIDAVTGQPFSAQDPETLLWVHCVEVHSFMTGYRAYGGSLTRAERDRYLAEQVTAAELIGVPRAITPDSVDAYREYFARVHPQLLRSEESDASVQFVVRPRLPGGVLRNGPLIPAFRTMGAAAAALVPRSLRSLAGLPQPGRLELPAGAAVVLASRAMVASRRVPWLGDQLDRRARGVIGVGPVPRDVVPVRAA